MAKRPEYFVVIACEGDVTNAYLTVDGKVVKKTQAKRNPKDKFSLRLGMETAFNRLWEKKEKEEKPKTFKVGDRVVCDSDGTNWSLRNSHGTVRAVRGDGFVGVEFDDRIMMGHTLSPCNPAAKHGHGWWCIPEALKHESEVK